jgi:hypothetical protein
MLMLLACGIVAIVSGDVTDGLQWIGMAGLVGMIAEVER